MWKYKGYEGWSLTLREWISAYLSLLHTAYTWADEVWIAKLDAGLFAAHNIKVEGLENLHSAVNSGRGVIIIGAHKSGAMLAGYVLPAQEIKAFFLMEDLPTKELSDLVRKLRSANGLEVVPVGFGALEEVIRRLKSGKAVVMLADRDIQGHGEVFQFLGSPAKFPSGPVKIAIRTNSLLLPILHRRIGWQKLELRCFPAIDPKNYQEEARKENLQKALIRFLEEDLLETPSQMIGVERRWLT